MRGEVFGPFASEQLHSLATSLAKVMQPMRRLAAELISRRHTSGKSRFATRFSAGCRASSWPIRYQLHQEQGRWRLQFDFDHAAFDELLSLRLGRTTLPTNRLDWTAEQVVATYSGQQPVERVFRGLKQGDWLGWRPMHHWTDRKIRIHAFYCMLEVFLLQ